MQPVDIRVSKTWPCRFESVLWYVEGAASGGKLVSKTGVAVMSRQEFKSSALLLERWQNWLMQRRAKVSRRRLSGFESRSFLCGQVG